MSFFRSMEIAASAMTAERFRMDVISQNISNASTGVDANGNPYRRKIAVTTGEDAPQFALPCGLGDDDDMSASAGHGVKVAGVTEDQTPFKMEYDPDSPFAMKSGPYKGYVPKTNVNVIEEMTNMIAASRAFEANSSVIEAEKGMASKALEIGRS